MERRLVWTCSHSVCTTIVLHTADADTCWHSQSTWPLPDRIYSPGLTLSHQVMSFSTAFQLCFQTPLPSIFWPPLHPYLVFALTPTIFSSLSSLVLLYAFATIGVSGNIHSLRTCPSGSSFNSTHHRPWISIGPPSTFASGFWDLLSIRVNISS
jgi:hypothetical protein